MSTSVPNNLRDLHDEFKQRETEEKLNRPTWLGRLSALPSARTVMPTSLPKGSAASNAAVDADKGANAATVGPALCVTAAHKKQSVEIAPQDIFSPVAEPVEEEEELLPLMQVEQSQNSPNKSPCRIVLDDDVKLVT